MRILSAAGSKMVPNTERIPYRRARYPSARSVSPAYSSNDVARWKLLSNTDHPRTGHANIREAVRRLGMVYMFSLSVGFRWSLSRDDLEHEQLNRRVQEAMDARLDARTVDGTRQAPEGRMYDERDIRTSDMYMMLVIHTKQFQYSTIARKSINAHAFNVRFNSRWGFESRLSPSLPCLHIAFGTRGTVSMASLGTRCMMTPWPSRAPSDQGA